MDRVTIAGDTTGMCQNALSNATDMRRYTVGEIAFAAIIGLVVAALTAIAVFVGVIFLCARLFTGEASYSGLLYGPLAAIMTATAAFAVVFLRVLRYGNSPKGQK